MALTGLRRVSLLSVLAVLVGLSAGSTRAAGSELRLKAGHFDPTISSLPLAPGLRLAPDAGEAEPVRIVQFARIPDAALRTELERAGARVLAYLPDDALVVRVDAAALARVRQMVLRRWDGPVQPGWKIAPDLGTRPVLDASRRAGGRILSSIELWPDAEAGAVAASLRGLGLTVQAVFTNDGLRRILVRGSRAELERAASLSDVAYVEDAPEPAQRNDAASWVIQSFVPNVRPIWAHGLHGEGQIMGNIDGRLDMNSCYFNDGGKPPGPTHRKVIAYRSNSGQGADSHGTHTNGTMAGDSGTPGAWDSGDGHAFAAKISFANLSDIDGSGSAPSNLLDYLNLAHGDGARVHSNSWGDDGTTQYTSWCRDIDEYMWQNEDGLVLFAVTNTSSLRTPENAKNVLAVGATQREASAENHCSGGAGPTSDGRRKPEIYAPGCSTVSAASGQSCGTRSLTGTSMACPAVTGAAALVRQYFTEGWYPSGTPIPADSLVPSGALMKAVLINGAVDMTGVAGYPSNLEGWGRVQLERSLYFDGDARSLSVLADVRRAEGLQAGAEATFTVSVLDSAEPLRVTLAYSEPPAALLASSATVNNLDLKVEAPDGTLYWGNRTNGNGSSIPGGSPDAINNLEMVLLDNPATGTWTVTVIAAAVPAGPQGYALIASGSIAGATGTARLVHKAHRTEDLPPLGGNDGILDPGETAVVAVTLENRGSADATAIDGVLDTDRPEWLRITRKSATWPDLPSRASAETHLPHFEITALPHAPCGEAALMRLTMGIEGLEPQTTTFTIDLGNKDRDFPDGPPLDIPQRFLGLLESAQSVADAVNVGEIDVTVDIDHGDAGELLVALLSPSGTQVILHNRSHDGESGIKTRYDLDRPVDGPGTLDDFVGEPAQGVWKLQIGDNNLSTVPPGRLNGWTLHLKADRALSCMPLSCGDATPPAATGLTVSRLGSDALFIWDATPGASGYNLLEASQPLFAAPVVTGRTEGATTFVSLSGAAPAPAITYYQLRATNSCRWEGP